MNATRWGLLLGVLMVFLGLVWWLTGEDEVTAVERTPPVQPVAERLEASSLPEARETRELVAPPIAAPPVAEQAPLQRRATPRPQLHPVDPEALAREAELLEHAKLQVKTDPERALRSLTEHQQLFPESERAQDFELVRLEAFLRLGRRDEAERLGKKLTARDAAARKFVDQLLNDVQPH